MGVRATLTRHILILSQGYKIKNIATPNLIWEVKCALSRTPYIASLNRNDLE
jgi:hypothetical protein